MHFIVGGIFGFLVAVPIFEILKCKDGTTVSTMFISKDSAENFVRYITNMIDDHNWISLDDYKAYCNDSISVFTKEDSDTGWDRDDLNLIEVNKEGDQWIVKMPPTHVRQPM